MTDSRTIKELKIKEATGISLEKLSLMSDEQVNEMFNDLYVLED